MTIAPLTLPDPSAPPDDDGLLMCGPPHDFAIGAFHCKPQSSEKSGKMAFYAPPAFQKAPQGELLVLNGCNGKTWGGTGSGTNQHEVPMAPLDTFMRLHATNGVLVLPEYAFALCEPGAWPFLSTMDINILPEALPTILQLIVRTRWKIQPILTQTPTPGPVKDTTGTRAKARTGPKVPGLPVVPLRWGRA